MKKITITDVTLRDDSSQKGIALSFKEKIEISKLLDNLCVDTIELSSIVNLKTDILLYRTISSLMKNSSVSCPVGGSASDIDNAWEAIACAKYPKLVVRLPLSTVQMEYICHKKPEKMLEYIKELVSYAASKCPYVEFCAEDATRAEKDFLITAIKTAVLAGAKAVTVCDTAGSMLPEEIKAFIKMLKNEISELNDTTFGVECSDSLNMAVAAYFSCIGSEIDNIKVVTSGKNLPCLDDVIDVFAAKGDELGVGHNVNSMILKRTLGQIRRITSGEKFETPVAAQNTPSSEISGSLLDITANITKVSAVLTKLGYDLSEEDLYKVYEEFIRVAKKKQVGIKELDAIVASTALQVPPTFKLLSYVMNSGNIITSTAHIVLEKNGVELSGLSTGDGPIDAAFHAIEQIIGKHYELDDFQIFSITEGKEAMGQALVKLRFEGKLYSGSGISTDIISASIRAYINALNKIVYEERNV